MIKRRIPQNLINFMLVTISFLLIGTVTFFAETVPSDVTLPDTAGSEPYTLATEPVATSLPQVEDYDVEIPQVIGAVDKKDEPTLGGGFVMWIILGVLVAVILAVILTSKTKAYRGSGKKRYSTGDKISGQRHLLNDKYYHNRKRK